MLGPYRLISELGSGGMGTVYLASVEEEGPGLRKTDRVAVKVVFPQIVADPETFQRFLREIDVGKRIRHENVVHTIDAGLDVRDDGEFVYLAMEYVAGRTLRQLLTETGAMSETLCRRVARDVARALVGIHGAGVVHRDLKPENVLITPDEVLKVMDLGVAHLHEEAQKLSMAGAFAGSLWYAAPEQMSSEDGTLDGRADLYALGVTLYELASGGHPFGDADIRVVIRRQLTEHPQPLIELNPGISPFFSAVVDALLQKERDARFGSAAELLTTLTAAEESRWWRTRRNDGADSLRRLPVRRDTDLHGRETELRTLQRLLETVRGGEGRVLLLEGEAGIGKTRLLDTFFAGAQREEPPAAVLFASWMPGGEPSAVLESAFSSMFATDAGEERLSDYLRRDEEVLNWFLSLVRGEPAEQRGPLPMRRFGAAIVRVLRRLSRDGPVILLLDDHHHASGRARSLLAAVARAVMDAPVLVIVSGRHAPPADWIEDLRADGRVETLRLERLDPGSVAGLLQDALGSGQPAPQLTHSVSRDSEGNPLFALEILRALRANRRITRTPDGRWATQHGPIDVDLPGAVSDVIAERLAIVEPEEFPVLQRAACAGQEFDPAVVAEAADIDTGFAASMLESLADRGLLRRDRAGMHFDHQLLRTALYTALDDTARTAGHRALADVYTERLSDAVREDATDAVRLELAAQACRHRLHGGQEDLALPHLDAALTLAEQRGDDERLLRLTARLLAPADLLSGVARLDVILRRLLALQRLERHAEQSALLEEARGISAGLVRGEGSAGV